VVTITGGSGFVGQWLRRGLHAEGWRVRVYDPYRGPLVDLVRRRHLATATRPRTRRAAARIRSAQKQAERALLRAQVIRATSDSILADRERLAASFAGSTALVHLAGIPHPHQPGATDADFVRLNYDEFPGFRSTTAANLYVSTSIENLVAGVACALRPPETFGHAAFNLCDAEVDPRIVDIQAYLAHRWPNVPNRTTQNACLLSSDKARRELGYRPVRGGRYCAEELVW
jgi:nucleoside-diphosphate-sugar epimerase